VSLYFKLPAEKSTTVADYRRSLIGSLYLSMLNDRFGEMTQRPDAPFTAAGASKGGFVGRELAPFSLSANVVDGGVEKGLEALLIEARRVDQFGFLDSELQRAKQDLVRGYERAHAERDKSQSGGFADEYIRVYLEGESTPGIEWEYQAVQKLLPTISVADVNRLAASWITENNRVVIVGAPIKEGVVLPTEAGILAAIDRGMKAPVVAYSESVSGDALVDALRPAGRIVSGKPRPNGVSEWQLSNGARVLVKPTDFKADQILFGAYSPGGTAHASDADFISAALSSQIVGLSGLGSLNRIDLGKKLSGKVASVSPSIGEMSEGLGGSASPKDIETMMQLAYLTFTGARLDTTAFAAFRNNVGPYLANRGSDPSQVFSDTIQVTLAQYHNRARPITLATLAEINAEKAIAFHKDRFADASDFTFVFVGNVDTTTLKPLVERYLASLPSTGRKDGAASTTLGPPRGVINKTVRKGVEQKASTLIVFSGACDYSPQNRFALRTMVDAFQLRLTEALREKLGGTYSPNVGGGCARSPRQEYSISVSFDSSPENVESLTQAVFALVDSLKTQGPTQADVDRVREQITRSREVEVKQNNYWLSNIMAREQSGEDIGGLLGAYDEMVKSLTASQIRDAARRYLDTSNYARFVLLPELPTPRP
jgi:zinc protease